MHSITGTVEGDQPGMHIRQGARGADAFIAFHIVDQHAVYFGLDGGTNRLSVGGWSLGAASYALYHEGYKPTKADVGLGALPNAMTDQYDNDNSGVLATAKAVNDLYQYLLALINGKPTILSGTEVPSDDIGKNGDLYIRV